MPKFRKKPVVIEAWQVPAIGEYSPDTPAWLLQAVVSSKIESVKPADGALLIHTLEGVMRADVGDWVIQGVKGELYPCKPDIFAATYEAAEG